MEPEIVVEPAGAAQAAVIWLHGLGASAREFAGFPRHLRWPGGPRLRWVLPQAPVRPVTVFDRVPMAAWYDLLDLERRDLDEAGIRQSGRRIAGLVERQLESGMAPRRIVLAGFSQGASLALYTGLRAPQPLAGILVLSGYLLLADRLAAEASPANRAVPVLCSHGLTDTQVPLELGMRARETLTRLGWRVEWHTEPRGHTVEWETLERIRQWLRTVLGGEEAAAPPDPPPTA